MGFLTDPKKRQAVISVIGQHHQKFSLLLYVVGLVWFLGLAYEPFNAGTYFSENALLPGLVESDLPDGFPVLANYANAVKYEMLKDKKSVPKDWIFKQFQGLGLETFYHNFNVSYPFKATINQVITGRNIFAIMRARRTASTEALVMCAPFRTSVSAKTHTDGSVALMLALASQFRHNPYWAKDIIFLLTDFEEVGVRAWLDAYHGMRSEYIDPGELTARSGVIQAAVNLELPTDPVQYVNIRFEGLNGQLPNLDLFNLAVRLSHREMIPATLHHRRDPANADSWQGFQRMLGTLMRMMWSQASGSPTGNHGMFHRFHIEALTIEGVVKRKGSKKYDLELLSRVVEGVFRSLNNLLEQFHQSFYFYLLPATTRYISIGCYMPPFCLMIASGVVQALALATLASNSSQQCVTVKGNNSNNGEVEDSTISKPDIVNDPSLENAEEPVANEDSNENDGGGSHVRQRRTSQSVEGKDAATANNEGRDAIPVTDSCALSTDPEAYDAPSSGRWFSLLPVVVMCYLLGLLTYNAPSLLARLSPGSGIKSPDTVFVELLAVFTASLVFPYLMNRKASPYERIGSDWRLVKVVGLIIQSIALSAVSLLNISLAFFVTAVSIPVTLAIKPTDNTIRCTLQRIGMLLISPVGLLFMAAVVESTSQASTTHSTWDLVTDIWNELKQMVFMVLVDQHLISSWTYTLASFALLPTWLLFWSIPFCSQ